MGMPSRIGRIYLECILRGGKNFFHLREDSAK